MKNRFFISVVTSLMLSNNVVNAKEISLQEAVDSIVKEYKVTYISKSNSLKDKKIDEKKINYKENALNSLNNILESNDLKAIEEDGVIYIIEKPKKQTNSKTTILEEISVNESYKNGTAENGYLSENITGVGLWGKRSLQDTPYSMTVISNDLIENSLAKDMNQIFKMNSTTQETATKSAPASDSFLPIIRGFNPRILVNGIPHSMGYRSAPIMQNIDKVEIINGATGFLYGGGNVGGAINYITKKPTTQDLRTVTIGSYGDESYFSNIDLGGQFDNNHTFGYRINALYQNGELPSTTNTEQKAISFVFDWKPTDNFYTDIKYSHKDLFEKGANTVFNSVTNRPIIKNQSYSPDWIENEVKSDIVENSVNWNINDIFTLRTNLSYEKTKHRGDSLDVVLKDNIALQNPTNYWRGTSYTKNAWQETTVKAGNIYLDSKFETFDINHNLTVGYSSEVSKYYRRGDNWTFYTIDRDMSLSELKNLSKPSSIEWDNNGIVGAEPLKPRQKLEFNNVLIGDDIVFNDQWSALVGANYATIKSMFYPSNYAYDKSELTPTLSLMYKPFEDLTTYITYIENLEQGDQVPNDPSYNNPGNILDPYKSKQYEIGAKYSLNEKVLLTTALFRIEKANWYEATDSNGKINYSEDGEQIHEGIEIGITGKVTDDFTVVAGGTLMDLSVEKATNPTLEGKKPTDAASKMAKVYAEYEIPQIKGLALTGGAYYTGKKYADESNLDILPSYTLYDAGLRYKTKLEKYPTTFILNVQNLTDKDYWGSSTNLGDPRSVAFSMKMEF
ncbi:TonB-dependent receptor [Aliarcobacter butzleri]|uniref:TonB-dependent receptor n=1 Tax=Aliarcobacter butzleri TaxID=28197 RepID=UPI003AF8463C